jgi:two-component system, chemotaxis family, sensor kinase CheA
VAPDRYRYYRVEAAELLAELSDGALALEHEGSPLDVVRRLLRLAHTLKGASRVVKQPEIAEHAHAIEELLVPYRNETASARPGKTVVDRLLAALDGIRARLGELAPPSSPVAAANAAAGSPAAAGADASFQSVRVALNELDEVLEAATRLGVVVERLGGVDTLGTEPRAPVYERDELVRELDDLRERIFRMRLLPVEMLFADLRRAVRDAAGELDKAVEIEFQGGDIRLDAHVLAALRGALLHLVRNSVAHGIEDAAARALAGKPQAGTITLAIARRGHRAVLTCSDDGRGIDEPAVKKAAAQRGIVSAADARSLGQNEVVELLLRGGLSTSPSVTAIAGRGVGLEVVSDTVRRLKGETRIRSIAGAGTTIELNVPVSLSAMPVLAVHAGGASMLIPLDAIHETVRIDQRRVCTTPAGETLLWNDQPLPLVPLASLLGAESGIAGGRARTAVVLRGAKGDLALGVDQVLDVREIVVQPLPPLATASALIAGVALGGGGVPRLVMAPSELDPDSADARTSASAAPVHAPPPPVLVIDDSLTTRMLEQTILEAAGYEVDLAVSAEDGLAKAERRRYGLFIVDVEMPGMNGFEFVARTRADPRFAAIPCILVTSRNAPEDRRQGQEAGAAAYFVKSEFSQDALLASIQRLLA